MLRLVGLVACLVLVLSGCSSHPPVAAQQSPTQTFTVVADAGLPPSPSLTDTLHFLDAPHLAGTLANGQPEIRLPIPSNVPGSEPLQWSLPRPAALEMLQARVHLFVDVQGTLPNTGANGCFWYVSLLVPFGDDSYYVDPMCATEGPLVQAGLHELVLSNTGFDLHKMQADHILIQLSIDSVPPPGASATLVTGTSATDGTITIDGLQLPLDTQTLLQ